MSSLKSLEDERRYTAFRLRSIRRLWVPSCATMWHPVAPAKTSGMQADWWTSHNHGDPEATMEGFKPCTKLAEFVCFYQTLNSLANKVETHWVFLQTAKALRHPSLQYLQQWGVSRAVIIESCTVPIKTMWSESQVLLCTETGWSQTYISAMHGKGTRLTGKQNFTAYTHEGSSPRAKTPQLRMLHFQNLSVMFFHVFPCFSMFFLWHYNLCTSFARVLCNLCITFV